MQEEMNHEALAQAHQRWQQARQAELSGPDSWLGLIGLCWLEEGINPLGSAQQAAIRLPDGPEQLGNVIRQADKVFWQAEGAQAIELQTDKQGQPSTVDLGKYAFFIVDRDGQLAVRIRDRQWASRQSFPGLSYFAFDPAWRIKALWQPLVKPLQMEVPNVSGELKIIEVTHQAEFTIANKAVILLPMSVSEREVFFVFRDQTSGKQSYGAGRFLKADPAVDGEITLDFNFAYNPPCAFTAFATCPLPPAENWLSFPVNAGEQKPPAK